MRLSEAMRNGFKGKRQISHLFSDGEGGVCALGAVWAGAGGTFVRSALGSLNLNVGPLGGFAGFIKMFPVLLGLRECPLCPIITSVYSLIPHLNNVDSVSHGKTIEYIADWIEREIEKPLEIKEREDGHPPMVENKEVMAFMGEPVRDEVLR